MKLVIDSNQLNNPKLAEFLARSSQNFAILSEFVSMEIYKGDSFNKVPRSMEILSQFPDQVIILKGARKLSVLNGRLKGLHRRFVDDASTNDFKSYLRALEIASSGDIRYQKAVKDLSRYANEHFEQMLADVEGIKDSIVSFTNLLTKEEKTLIRKNEFYTAEILDKISRAIFEISEEFIVNSNLGITVPTLAELPNTYYFRVILASFLMGVVRAAEGEIKSVRPGKFRNDMVDMSIATVATYFDGIMSDDRRLNEMYGKICRFLNLAFQVELPKQLRN